MNLVYNTADKSLSVEGTSESVAKPSIEESVSQSVNDILNSAETSVEFEHIEETGKDIVDYFRVRLFIGIVLLGIGIGIGVISTLHFKKIKIPNEKDELTYRILTTISIIIALLGLIVAAVFGFKLVTSIL